MHQQQIYENQITYQQRRAYPARSTITSPNHNYNHTVYVSSTDDVTNEHDAYEKEYQNLQEDKFFLEWKFCCFFYNHKTSTALSSDFIF